MSKLKELVEEVLNEAAKVNFAGNEFVLKVDVNEDPQKKGVKIQFLPTQFGSINATQQNDIAIELEERLNAGLGEFDLKVERDRNLKDKTIIGFFVYIEYFDKVVRKALKGENPEGGDDAQTTDISGQGISPFAG